MIRRATLLLLLPLALALLARADDASKIAKIHEYFRLAKLDQLSEQMKQQVIDQMSSGMMDQIVGVTLSPDQEKTRQEFSDKIQQVVFSAVSWEKLEPEYTKIYADQYTEQQIDDILAFYKSPSGQAMVQKTPIILKQSSAVAQQHLEAVMPELQRLMKEEASKITGGQSK